MTIPNTAGNALDDLLEQSVQQQALPFVVAAACDARGVIWSGQAGFAAPGVPADPDTVFRLYSMTKAIGALAAMLLVDRQRLSLDDAVAQHLPEAATLQVLQSDAQGKAVLRPPARPVTVRDLATHTSGLCYEYWQPALRQYLKSVGAPTVTVGTRAALHYPLLFDPGTRWGYGIGIDWLGLLVEAVDGRRIDRFCAEEIFGPLGMSDTRFAPDEAMRPRLARAWARGPDGFAPIDMQPPAAPEVYGMGHALYGTASDYLRFLRLLLNGGRLDGVTLLSAAATQQLLANQTGALPIEPLRTAMPRLTADLDLYPGSRKSHSVLAMRFEDGVPEGRLPGAQGWAGILNTHFWMDPRRPLAAVFMTQLLPFADPEVMRVYQQYERIFYADA